MLELEVLQCISSSSTRGSHHRLSLLDHFIHPAKDGEGTHICLVTDVLGGTVASLMQQTKNRSLPVPLAKRVLRQMLMGLAHVHKHGVVHTGTNTLAVRIFMTCLFLCRPMERSQTR